MHPLLTFYDQYILPVIFSAGIKLKIQQKINTDKTLSFPILVCLVSKKNNLGKKKRDDRTKSLLGERELIRFDLREH